MNHYYTIHPVNVQWVDFFITLQLSGEEPPIDVFSQIRSAAGDIDGDGLDDVIIGDPQPHNCSSNCGRAYIYPACEN